MKDSDGLARLRGLSFYAFSAVLIPLYMVIGYFIIAKCFYFKSDKTMTKEDMEFWTKWFQAFQSSEY